MTKVDYFSTWVNLSLRFACFSDRFFKCGWAWRETPPCQLWREEEKNAPACGLLRRTPRCGTGVASLEEEKVKHCSTKIKRKLC